MFELTEKTVEQIVFAMEDQEHALVVDLENGEVLPAEGLAGELYTEAPTWSSRDGFRLMEEFLASVRQPSVRRELSAALARGRGVFKAFKAALAEHQELERAFRSYKIRAMRLTIANWYDDLREARGLERLGPEPEEVDDLLSSDLEIRLLPLDEARSLLESLVDQTEEECVDSLPGALAAFEVSRLRSIIADASDALCAVADDGEGGALGLALGVRTIIGERGIGRIVFLRVQRDFRRMGLATALLGSLTRAFENEGLSLIVLDSAFLPAEFGASLAALGFVSYGLRALTRQD